MSSEKITQTDEKELILEEIKRLRKELDLCNSINNPKINSDKMLSISRALDEKINEYHRLEKTGG